MLNEAKLALRLRGSALDGEVNRLIAAAKADLRLAGIVFDDPPENVTETITNEGESPPEQAAGDPLVMNAIILYCKAYLGTFPDAERHERAYLYQKRALALAYTRKKSGGEAAFDKIKSIEGDYIAVE